MKFINNKCNIWYYLLIGLLFFSCVKEVEIEIPKVDEKLVINSFFSPDTTFIVQVSKSAYIYDTSTILVNNATVRLYRENEFIDSLQSIGSGLYRSNIKPIENEEYEITAFVTGSTTITAKDQIPKKNHIISSIRIDNVGADEYENAYSQAKITFKDNPNTVDYYEIILYYTYNSNPFCHIMENDTFCFIKDTLKGIAKLNSDDPVLASEIETDWQGYESLICNDELFNGKEYTISVNYRFIITNHIEEDYTLYVCLNSISEDYYNYRKKTYQYQQNEKGLWNNTGEIVQVFSNIENGYGIFAGYSQDIDTLYYLGQ